MLISKFDLYKREWLELVFDDRNKEYGAYELRQHYARDVVRSMGLMFFGVFLLCLAYVFFRPVPTPTERIIPFDNSTHVIQIKTIKTPDLPHPPKALPRQPAKPVPTVKNVPYIVKPDIIAEKPVKTVDLEGKAIGQTTTKGPGGPAIDLPVEPVSGGGGGGPVAAPDNSVHTIAGVDVMPEPVGGNAAWAKFLNKTLRFPAPAQDEGASGRVILSFIIEKDGSLSNIKVDVPAGHGFDEEAMRVLKLAKAWKPGLQNGQPVRVKFNIPINFQALEQ